MRAFLQLRQHVAASLRMLLIFTVMLGVAYPLLITAIAQMPGLQEPRRRFADQVRRQRSSARSCSGRTSPTGTATRCRSTSSRGRPRPATATTRPRPARATSVRSRSSTRCPTRLSRRRHRQAEPAHPGLLAQPRDRASSTASTARGRSAPPTVSARCSRCSGPGPGYHGTITRVVSLNQTAPATAVPRQLQGRPGRTRQVRCRTTRRARSCRSAATRRPTRPCPPTR